MINKFVNKIKNTNSIIYEFFRNTVIKARFYLPVLFFIAIAYSFSFFNRTISIDDLNRDYYYGVGHAKIAGTRWGQALVVKLLSQIKITPFIDQFIGVILLFLSACVICSIFYYLNKNKTITYVIFTSFFVTYPLINEIWSYNEACIPRGFCMLIIAYSVLFIMSNKIIATIDYAFVGLLMSIVASGCEASLFCYVTIVVSILFIKSCDGNYHDNSEWIKEGLLYVVPLLLSILFRYLIGFLLIKLYDAEYLINGAGEIYWFDKNKTLFEIATKMVKSNVIDFFIRGFSYFPIGEYVLTVLMFIIFSIKNINKKGVLFLSIIVLISPFLICVIQGNKLNYRSALPIQYFVAYVFYLVSTRLEYKKVLLLLILFICYRQCIYLNSLLSLNNLRSENEEFIARTIGYNIYSKYDKNKPVVFCGEYHLSDFINDQVSINENDIGWKIEDIIRKAFSNKESDGSIKYVQTNVNSCLSWNVNARDSQILMKDYLSYCGFDVFILDINGEEIKKYEKIAVEEKMKDLEIKDMGSYLLVYLGPSSSD